MSNCQPFTSLQIEYLDPRTLKNNPFNPNVVDAINQDKLEKSIATDGFYDAIKVRTLPDGSLEILGGQHRCRAAIKLGFEKVPVINLGEIPDARAKLICLKDNANYGVEDPDLMRELLNSDIGTAEDLLSVLPIDADSLAAFFEHDTTLEDFEAELEAPTVDDTAIDLPVTKAPKTHQILRFKIPIDDLDRVQERIERVQREQGLVDNDSLVNAGDALVWILFQGENDAV